MLTRFLSLCTLLLWCTLSYAHAPLDFADLVERVSPAVVNVSATPKIGSAQDSSKAGPPPNFPNMPDNAPLLEFWKKFFGEQGRHSRPAFGSGFILSKDGYIITNAHVVKDAERVVVKLSDRRELQAEIIGSDARSDIALLKVQAENLPVVQIGSSDELRVGQGILAIGSPFGFEHSVSFGIISALGRSLPTDNYVPFIQTDAAVNPGNSGGPLLDLQGKVVGINSQIYTDGGGSIGLSFAIPVKLAMYVFEQLKEHGSVTRGWLGVYVQEVTQGLSESFGMERPQGALVTGIFPDSPASEAKLEAGDIILQFDAEPISEVGKLSPIVGRTQPGKEVDMVILRNRKTLTLEVEISELPQDINTPSEQNKNEQKKKQSEELSAVGMTVKQLSPEEIEKIDVEKHALYVENVELGGVAHQSGLRIGDLILSINNEDFSDLKEFIELLENFPAGHFITLFVQRNGMTRFFALRIPEE
ncbi:MAG: Do family serine endopeptidase [Candidatus Oxydemutatoraceae bacterium WSBS_2016_MAG_OTU14]